MGKASWAIVAALVAAGAASVAARPAAASSSAAPHWKVWLCGPPAKVDWCNVDMRVTLVDAKGRRRVDLGGTASKRVDCFYVYPSLPGTPNDLKVDEMEKQIVIGQASRFGQACRVFAPLYRQNPHPRDYTDVRAAWRDYLGNHNGGRGFVLIGHSQGAYILERLIAEEIEGSPALRRQLVSAVLLGGSVSVRKGRDTGGTFRRTPACRAARQFGCVVAYASWGRTPPAAAAFQGPPEHQTLCVNPAAPAGGSAPITPLFPWFLPEGIVTRILQVPTMWIAFPGKYTARCVSRNGRAWLLVEDRRIPGDRRETVREVLDPSWGLHAADVNIALQELVELVRAQGKAWIAAR